MLLFLRSGIPLLAFVLLSACGAGAGAVPEAAQPEAVAPIPIAPPGAYVGDRARGAKGDGRDELCKIDPAACPTLDMNREAGRQVRDGLFAVPQVDEALSAGGDAIRLTGPLSGAPAVRKTRQYGYSAEDDAGGGGAAPAPTPPAPIPVKPARATRAEQLDIEAKVQLEVAHMGAARRQVAVLLDAFGGQTMNEAIEDGAGRRGISLSVRVPSAGVRSFVARLAEVGKVRSSTLETREVSRELSDAAVIQRNLEQALARYEQLLAKAANVAEATAIEGALMRVRTELDRVRGDIEWAKDRVARSTVYITLSLAPTESEPVPLAKFYPGVRAVLLVDVPPVSAPVSTTTYAGAGLSLQWTRSFDIDLDFLNDLTRARGSAVDFYSLTLGSAFYSDYLGGGKRRSFNPYFGFRTGYAHAPHQSLFPLGGVVGVELVKSEVLLFSLEARAYGLIGRKEGPDLAVEPGLGLNVAY